jgi:hypothetical protein
MITLEDVHEFGHRWFDTVGRGGSAEDQAAFFLDKHERIYIVWNGVTFSLEEHHGCTRSGSTSGTNSANSA